MKIAIAAAITLSVISIVLNLWWGRKGYYLHTWEDMPHGPRSHDYAFEPKVEARLDSIRSRVEELELKYKRLLNANDLKEHNPRDTMVLYDPVTDEEYDAIFEIEPVIIPDDKGEADNNE